MSRADDGLERLVSARTSGDLGRDSDDLRILAAAGLTLRRLGPLASVLPRLAGEASPAAMAAALAPVQALVWAMSARRQWRLNGAAVEEVSTQAITLYVRPRCTHCHGTGHRPGAGDSICRHCKGTGQRQPPRARAAEILATLDAMRAMERVLGAALSRSAG